MKGEDLYLILWVEINSRFDCDCFKIGQIFSILGAKRFCLVTTGLSLFCTADGICDLLQYIGSDLPDYTML